MDEDIKINIEAKYQQVDELISRLDKLTNQFKGLSKVKADKNIKAFIKASADPISAASKSIDDALKNVDKLQTKLRQAIVVGDRKSIERLQKEVTDAENRVKVVLKSVKTSPVIKKQTTAISEEYNLKGYQNAIDLIARQSEKYDNEEAQRKQRIIDSQIQAAERLAQLQREYQEQLALQRQIEADTAAQDAVEKFMLSLDPVKEKLVQINQKIVEAQGKLKGAILDFDTKGVENAQKEIRKLNKELEKTKTSTKKTSSTWSKLVGRIRNISIYRAIRTGIKWLTSGVQEGLNNLAQYSDSVNSTMSNLNASMNQIKNTMGIAFASVLQALEPLLTSVANSLVDIINSFNLAMAKMQGENVYTKATKNVEDYAASLKKAQKFSFDTFEVLSGDQTTPISNMFEEGNVEEDANELSSIFGQILEIIESVGVAIKEIFQSIQPAIKPLLVILTDIIEPIKDIIVSIIPPLTNIITSILPALVNIIKYAAQIIEVIMPIITEIVNIILPMIEIALNGIADLLGFIANLLTGNFEGAFENLKGYFKDFANWILYTTEIVINAVLWICKVIINSVIAAINLTIDLINLVLKPLDWIVKLFGGKTNIQIPKVPYLNLNFQTVSLGGFENGGIPDKSELFYMNERGIPEALVNTGGNQTNVINIDQLSEGMRRGFVQAIYDTGLITAIQQQGNQTLMVDKDVLGRSVANSNGFINEVNRKNANLKLR